MLKYIHISTWIDAIKLKQGAAMRKFFVRLLCCFVPDAQTRRKLRKSLERSRYDIVLDKISKLDAVINSLADKNTDLSTRFETFAAPKTIPDYRFNGKNNKLLIWDNEKQEYVETLKKIPGLNIQINGDNNIIKLDDVSIIGHLNILLFGFNHSVHIGKSLHTPYKSVIKDCTMIAFYNNTELTIGDNFVASPNVCISLAEPRAKIKIGDNVRLAENVRLFASDAHPIVDVATGQCINFGYGKRCLTIGNNCWIGMYSYVGKNTVLPDYTIVASHSVVSKAFTDNYTLIAGVPAKVIKTGVKRVDLWQEVLPPEYFE